MLNVELEILNVSMKTENIILEKTFDFALSIIELYKIMVAQKEFVLSKQLLRSGTSIGANVEEATAAFSKKDFTAKMSISSKEARETRYWLRLLEKSKLVDVNLTRQLGDIEEIINILAAIVKTSQSR
jgi:four helix bundle protein